MKKEKQICDKCGKELRNKKALAGHMWFAHNLRLGEKATARREIQKLREENKVIKDIKKEVNSDGEAIEEIREHLTELKEILLNGLKPHKEEIIAPPSEKTEEKEKTFWEKLDEWLL